MSSVDERIVQMQFDNQAFEKGVNTTLGTLGRLNDSLDNLNNFNTGNLSSSIDDISGRLSNLGIIGATAIANITSKLVDLGLEFAGSLTIDQLTAGFEKYANVSKDVTAIMNQLGVDIGEANSQIEKLAWYSDATSYSYSAMVSAFKTFSAQNIAAETSIPMLMGIGNSLSYAGLAAEEASNGFNIYSRAISQGYMSLKEWRSLNAMGATTAGLKQQFIDAGIAMGQLSKDADGVVRDMQDNIVTIETFESTLSSSTSKWLTTDVMKAVFGVEYGSYTRDLYEFSQQAENLDKDIETLMEDYAKSGADIDEFAQKSFLAAQQARTFAEAVNAIKDAASTAWMNIFTNVFGNAVEATQMWGSFSTWLYDTFMGPTLLIAQATKQWNKFGGRNTMIDMFRNLADAIESVKKPLKEAFTAIFGIFDQYTIGAKLFEFTIKLKEITSRLILSEEAAGKLKTIVQGLFAALNVGKTVLGKIFDFAKGVFDVLKPLGSGILDITASIAEYIIKLEEAITNGNRFTEGLDDISERIILFLQDFHPLSTAINFFKDGVKGAVQGIKNFAGVLKETLGPALQNAFGSGTNTGILTVIGAFAAFKAIKWNLLDPLKAFVNLRKAITDTFDSLSGTLDSFSRSIQADALIKAAIGVALLAGSMLLLASIDPEKLATGLLGLAAALAMIIGTIKILNATNFKMFQAGRINKLTSGLMKLGIALILVAGACKILSTLTWEGLAKGAAAIAVFMAEFILFAKLMQNTRTRGIGSIILVAGAMLILAGALKLLSTIEFDKLLEGIIIMGLALAAFAGYIAIINAIGAGALKLLAAAAAFLIFSAAIGVLTASLLALSLIPFSTLMGSLLGIAIAVGIFVAAAALLSSFAIQAVIVSAAFLIFAAAIAVLTASLAVLSMLSLEKVIEGLLGLGLALVVLGVAGVVLSTIVGPMALAALGILAMSIALAALAVALGMVSLIDFTSCAEGLAAIAAAMLLFAGLSLIISPLLVPMLGLAAAMLVVAAAVAIFAGALTLLGGLNTGLLSTMAIALATVLASMTAMVPLLAAITVEMLALSAELVVAAASTIALDVAMAAMLVTAGLMAAGIEVAGLALKSASLHLNDFLLNLSLLPESTDKAYKNVKTFASNVKDEIKSLKNEFKQVGKDCGQGFIDGIKSKNSAASTAGYNLGQEALKAIKRSLQIKSPSKAFAKVGMYADQGLAKGISDYSVVSETAAKDLGNDTVNALANNMYAVTDLLSDEINADPVITPVLDLSEIQNGSNKLSELVSGQKLAASVSADSGKIDTSALMASELSAIKQQLLDLTTAQGVNVGEALKEALSGVGVYMDKSKVGNLVSSYQSNVRRAGGY